MFALPPSPMPFPVPPRESRSPPLLSPVTLETAADCLSSHVSDPPSPFIAEGGGPSWTPAVKKRSSRHILLFVALLPAALFLSACLRYFVRIPAPAVLDEPPALYKRGPPSPTPTSHETPTATFPSFPPTSSSTQSSPSSSFPSSSTLPEVPIVANLPTPLPEALDESLTDNFTTQGCQAFFANFTQEIKFRQCRAFSFLLETSAAFFQDQRNLSTLNDVLWGTCNTPSSAEDCAATMASYFTELNTVCKSDIAAQNPIVVQARTSFMSYSVMRTVGCLSDASTNVYCYINAVAANTPNDIFFYSLPFGTPLPNNTKPSCSPCVQSLLAVFAQYVTPATSGGSGPVKIGGLTGNSTAPVVQASPLPLLSMTYSSAARLAVNQCGGTYASVSVAKPNGALQLGITRIVVGLGLVLAASWRL